MSNNNGKIGIVGGGVCGMAAGIFARRNGFDAEIFEKNPVSGGCCSSWKRGPNKEYTIDNCLHWLTGWMDSMPDTATWKDFGVIGGDVKIVPQDYFFASEHNGQTLTLWRDIDRTKKEMLELSPEDEKEINRFIEIIRFAGFLQKYADRKDGVIRALVESNKYISTAELIHTALTYLRLDQGGLGQRFKHPLFSLMFNDFISDKYESYWLTFAYAIFACGNGNLPTGGSRGIAERIQKKAESEGVIIHLNSPVEKVVLETIDGKTSATGIMLKDGSFVTCDKVICACDINFTFKNLIPEEYAPDIIKKKWVENKVYPFFSSFQTAFAVQGEMPELENNITIDCREFSVATSSYTRFNVRNYRSYGDFIAPKGETVIQVTCPQNEYDFEYWMNLRNSPEEYKNAKAKYGQMVLERIEDRWPSYKGKIKLIDSWTPATYNKWGNCHYGAYMRFITKITGPEAFIDSRVKGLENVWISGQWIRYPGGLPEAVKAARDTIKDIVRRQYFSEKFLPAVIHQKITDLVENQTGKSLFGN